MPPAGIRGLPGVGAWIPPYAGDLFRQRDPDLPDAAHGVQAAIDRQAALPEGPLHVVIDSTCLKVYGAGDWLADKHGRRPPRQYRKLHLAVDADGGQIVAVTLTGQDVDDPSQVAPLLQIAGETSRSPPTVPMTARRPTRVIRPTYREHRSISFDMTNDTPPPRPHLQRSKIARRSRVAPIQQGRLG
ncbi:MAG: transposase [Burkholderiales bacterium]|nr:transposase [Burkholderiales bacterium]